MPCFVGPKPLKLLEAPTKYLPNLWNQPSLLRNSFLVEPCWAYTMCHSWLGASLQSSQFLFVLPLFKAEPLGIGDSWHWVSRTPPAVFRCTQLHTDSHCSLPVPPLFDLPCKLQWRTPGMEGLTSAKSYICYPFGLLQVSPWATPKKECNLWRSKRRFRWRLPHARSRGWGPSMLRRRHLGGSHIGYLIFSMIFYLFLSIVCIDVYSHRASLLHPKRCVISI